MSGQEATRKPQPAFMAVLVDPRVKSKVIERARELSRDTSKHLRRLIVDDLVKAKKLTKEEAVLLS